MHRKCLHRIGSANLGRMYPTPTDAVVNRGNLREPIDEPTEIVRELTSLRLPRHSFGVPRNDRLRMIQNNFQIPGTFRGFLQSIQVEGRVVHG